MRAPTAGGATPIAAHDRPGAAIAPREEPSLGPFLPRKGVGLALSASDIETYRSCPLRYKFARVLRIPTEQTLHQRFGIAVHQVLERYPLRGRGDARADARPARCRLAPGRLRRRRAGARAAREGARGADPLPRAPAASRTPSRCGSSARSPSASVRITCAGAWTASIASPARAGEEYELIDYKTSRPKTAEQLKDDIQLSLYALAAREAWQLESSRQAYYYVLDDLKVPVPAGEGDAESVKDTCSRWARASSRRSSSRRPRARRARSATTGSSARRRRS